MTVMDVAIGKCCGNSADECPHCMCCGEPNVDGVTDFCNSCKEHDGWCMPFDNKEGK